MTNGYNFTERIRSVLALAREEAATLRHEYVGTEHILLGILREGQGVAMTVLERMGVKGPALRDDVLRIIKQGPSSYTPVRDLPYTSRAKRVLELSMGEARELGHSYVGTEHALLGILLEEHGVAAQVLADAGVSVDNARAETLKILGTAATVTKPRATPTPPSPHLPRSAQRVRQIIAAAHDIAEKRKSPVLEPAHVAMALIGHNGGMANAALDRLNFDRVAAMAALQDISPTGTDDVDPEATLRPTPSLLTALDAMEATERGTAATHHLLLALINTCVEIDAVFAVQNISAERIRDRVRHLSG